MRKRFRKESKYLVGCMTDIWNRFDLVEQSVRATRFDDLPSYYSTKTIQSAKDSLRIRSVNKKGRWYWTYPKYTVDQVLLMTQQAKKMNEDLKKMGQEYDPDYKPSKIIDRPSSQTLKDVMRQFNYCAPFSDILTEMAIRGYSSVTTRIAKKPLGIRSATIDGVDLWVYPSTEVKNWLLQILGDRTSPHSQDGLVPIDDVITAAASKGWPPVLIKITRETHFPNFDLVLDSKRKKWCWAIPTTAVTRAFKGKMKKQVTEEINPFD